MRYKFHIYNHVYLWIIHLNIQLETFMLYQLYFLEFVEITFP